MSADGPPDLFSAELDSKLERLAARFQKLSNFIADQEARLPAFKREAAEIGEELDALRSQNRPG